MFHYARSARLSPDERLGEVAAIFAVGLLRLDPRAALPGIAPLDNCNAVAQGPAFDSPAATPRKSHPRALSFPTQRGSVCVSVNGIRDPYKEPRA